MSTPNKTATASKVVAQDDKRETGNAGLPGARPVVGVKPRLTDEQRAERKAKTLADHERLIEARTKQVCHFLKDMGVASLAGRITEYDDLSPEYVEASLTLVEERVAACRAALQARTVKTTAPKFDLRATAAKLAAQKNGTPLPPQ